MPEIAVYTTSQVARLFYVDTSTVRLWVKTGKLEPLPRIDEGSHYRFDKSYIDGLLAPRSAAPASDSPQSDAGAVLRTA